MEIQENTKEAMDWLCEAIAIQLQQKFNELAYSSRIRTERSDDNFFDYLDEDDCDRVRETFTEEYTTDMLLDDLKKDTYFMDSLKSVIENFADEAEFDSDAGDGYSDEPDWDTIRKEQLDYEENN